MDSTQTLETTSTMDTSNLLAPTLASVLQRGRHALQCIFRHPFRGRTSASLAVEVIPPRQATREIAALETAMAALAHETRRPIALELAGAPCSRHFILRAGDSTTLGHLVQQVRARWPQAVIRPLTPEADPLRLGADEVVSALELRPGVGADLPYHVPGERELSQEGADPLLGLLAAFGGLPPHTRAVAQLALVPARDAWSAPHQRRAVEHPLEPERARERLRTASMHLEPGSGGDAIGLPAALGLLGLLGIVALARWYVGRFPLWLRQDVTAWLHRETVHVTTGQVLWLITWGAVLLVALCILLLTLAWARGRMRAWLMTTPLYDQQLVQEKTARVAYRARLCLVVIGPMYGLPSSAPSSTEHVRRQWATKSHRSKASIPALATPSILTSTTVERRIAGAPTAHFISPMRSLAEVVTPAPTFTAVPPPLVSRVKLPLVGWLATTWRQSFAGCFHAWYEVAPQAALARILVGMRRMRTSRRATLVRRLGRRWWRARKRSWQRARARRGDARSQAASRYHVLEGFLGAYRQFHLATGAYFVPCWLPERRALRLVAAASASNGDPASVYAMRPVRDGAESDRTGAPHSTSPAQESARTDGAHESGGLFGRCSPRAGVGTPSERWSEWQRGLRRSRHFLSVADVAALWHLPQAADLADLPFVERTRARTLLVPEALTHPIFGFRVGVSTHAGHALPVYLPPDATRRNALAIAKTGKGKSTLLLSLARAALAERDSGLVLIDPHGDLAETLLLHVPEGRRDEVVLVDLGDRDYPIGLNPLDTTLFPDRDKAVSNMIAVFSQIWKDFWGPRMESALEAALKTLYEVNQAEVAQDPQDGPDRQYTLLDATPLMTFSAFRHSLMAQVRDPALKEYWMRFDALQPRLQQDIITPVTTKLDKFANSFVARRIVGQGRSTLNVADVIRQGHVLVVKTARGIVGHDTAALIGATLLGMLQVTLAEQVTVGPEQRRRVRVVVDEFQTLPGVDFGAMLSELRKFGASFALATQALAHLDALDRALRPTVLSNVDQLFAFAISAEDARLLMRELDGVVEEPDLIALDDFQCYVRLTSGGQRIPIFTLALDPPLPADEAGHGQVEALRQRSQRRVGRWVKDADTVIMDAAFRRKVVAEQQKEQHGQQHDAGRSQHPGTGQRTQGQQGMSQSEWGLDLTGGLDGRETRGTQGAQRRKRGTNRWTKKKANHGFDSMSPIGGPIEPPAVGASDADDLEEAGDAGSDLDADGHSDGDDDDGEDL